MSKFHFAALIVASGIFAEYVNANYDTVSWVKNSGYYPKIFIPLTLVVIASVYFVLNKADVFCAAVSNKDGFSKSLSGRDKFHLGLIWALTAPAGKLIWVKSNALDAALASLCVNEIIFLVVLLIMRARK